MSEYVTEFFTATTADDERNYFHGDVQPDVGESPFEKAPLPPGTYRVIDGRLCRILAGLPTEDVHDRLRAAAKQTP
jgi:hypothetical protein